MKKNPFKAGDRVAFYIVDERRIGQVCTTHNQIVIVGHDLENWPVHWKQCRRLKPKVKKEEPPKEVWLSIVEGVVGSVYLPDRPIPQGAIKYIRADE